MIPINYLAVLVAAIAKFMVGGLWYSPLMFANIWMKELGWDRNDTIKMESMKKGSGKAMAGSFVGTLLMSYIMAHVITFNLAYFPHTMPALQGLMTALMLWLGFVATTSADLVLYEGRKWRLFWINNGHNLVGMLVMGVILAVWR